MKQNISIAIAVDNANINSRYDSESPASNHFLHLIFGQKFQFKAARAEFSIGGGVVSGRGRSTRAGVVHFY